MLMERICSVSLILTVFYFGEVLLRKECVAQVFGVTTLFMYGKKGSQPRGWDKREGAFVA
jgi:hypothetical protein